MLRQQTKLTRASHLSFVVASAYYEAMNTNEWFQREKHVALHAQPKWFRILKWIVILSALATLVWWKGWVVAISSLLCLMAFGTILHFLLCWKTKGWTESWGPYKKIDVPK